ncbi:MAG: hypothetical protein QE272_04985 [Nevskia sp.]|nr:hypothetical protein [Nevskia sp.]
MSRFTKLRQVALVGPRIVDREAENSTFAWTATVATAFQGANRQDRSLVGSTFGLRVMLQDLATQPIRVDIDDEGGDCSAVNATLRLHPPRLLVGHLNAREYGDEQEVQPCWFWRALTWLLYPLIGTDPYDKLDACTLSFPAGMPYQLRTPVPDDPKSAAATHGFFTVAVTPVDPWPTPQRSRDLEVPRFALAEHRMRVLVNITGGNERKPLGFLRFIKLDEATAAAFVAASAASADARSLPRIEMPLISLLPSEASLYKEDFVALDLTPDGIELRATIANPMQAFDRGATPDRLPVVLRLAHQIDPMSPERAMWTLELVREEDPAGHDGQGHQIREALKRVRRGFVPNSDQAIFVDIDTQAETPAVRWPLISNRDGSLSLSRTQMNEHWRLWVDAKALDASLTGVPSRGAELPTVVRIPVDRLEILAAGSEIVATLDADRRDPADRRDAPDTVTGPHVVLDWNNTAGRRMRVINDRDDPVTWFFDRDALADELVQRYTRRGVQPPMAPVTHAFLPIADGWLQLPLALSREHGTSADNGLRPAAGNALRDAVPFAGPFETIVPAAGKAGPSGRRLTVVAADQIVARAKFVSGALNSLEVSLLGAAGTADGILWFATGSPTPEDVLPSLSAGPASVVGPPLQFRRETPSTAALSRIDSNTFSAEEDLVLRFPPVAKDDASCTAYVWQAYNELPLVTAVPITRTAAGSGLPSQTRGLLCRELDRSTLEITLTHSSQRGVPVLGVSSAEGTQTPDVLPLAASSAQQKITLVAVTTTGIEMQPDAAPFASLQARLSYQPPVLIDYFAGIRLPQAAASGSPASVESKPPPYDTPTSLDMPALFGAWQRAVDRMDLARVQEANAFGEGFVAQELSDVSVMHLFGQTVWKTRFGLETSAMVGGQTRALGTYHLGGASYSGERALHGLEMAFAVNGTELVPATAETQNPVAIVGFAAGAWKDPDSGMWRDSRAALSAEMPQLAALGNDLRGLVYREIRVIDNLKSHEGWRATLAKPVRIESPPGNDGRSLALWFRDLFLKGGKQPNERIFDPGIEDLERAIGPMQAVFDAQQLPIALHEWRFCNDLMDTLQGQSLYDIAIGPFRFRPLRLCGLKFQVGDGGGVTEATVLGSVSPPGDDPTSSESGPFGPDMAYRTGNLVAVTLQRNNEGALSFAGAKWDKAQVNAHVKLGGKREMSFRRAGVSVQMGALADPNLGQTTLRIDLQFEEDASDNGLPQFDTARMETILFGQRVMYEGGNVNVHEDSVTVTFCPQNAPAMAGSGVALSKVQLVWSAAGPHLDLEGEVRLMACDTENPQSDARELVWQRLGEPLWWLNLEVPTDKFKVKVDHQRGIFGIEVNWPTKDPQQPVAGLIATEPDIRASLTMALSAPNDQRKSAFQFPSRSGFGALSLITKTGATRRFDQVLLAEAVEDSSRWTSQIKVDLKLESYPSRIHWPVHSLPSHVGTPENAANIPVESLASTVTGLALRGRIGTYSDTETLRHKITMCVSDQSLPTSILQVSDTGQSRKVALGAPWSFIALATHTVDSAKQKDGMRWTTLDHVTAVDARQLVIAAHDVLVVPKKPAEADFAFAARVKRTDQPKDSATAVKGGLVLRAFAQAGFPVEALARHLAADMFDSDGELIGFEEGEDGIVVTGAGVTSVETHRIPEGPFWPVNGAGSTGNERHGIVLSLPWLTAVEPAFDFGRAQRKLAAFKQAHASEIREWDAPDIDWAAGSPMPLSRAFAPIMSPGSGAAPELAAMLRQLGLSASDLPSLQPVEQVFLRPLGQGAYDSITEQPLWLRSLLALRAWWHVGSPTSDDVTMLVPLDAGRIARFRLAPTTPKLDLSRLGRAGQLIAIDRSLTRAEPSQLIEILGSFQMALTRSRMVARAERLVKEPIAVMAIASERRFDDEAAALWTSVNVPADLDDAALDIPMVHDAQDRLYASPALGWPTHKGTDLAASGALGLGDDFPFQDLPEVQELQSGAPDTDVKIFGSGLSGRVTSLSLPARADNSQPAGSSADTIFIDAKSPVFVALGRKIIFDRPTNLPVVSPPARHLSPTEARAVVPVASDLETALKRVVQGHAAPIVPPLLERASLGMRPGAMAAEFDTLLFTSGQAGSDENLDAQFDRFGRPGHAGPLLLRQHRPPRAPALPRLPANFVKSHGRRTYVETDEVDRVRGRDIAKPFLLMSGSGTVLRDAGRSYRIRILDLPLRPDWQGTIRLHISSASHPVGGDALAKALANLGVLHTGARASLTIDGHILNFTTARWDDNTIGSIVVALTLVGAALSGTRSRLDAVDGDSLVFLSFRCGTQGNNATPPNTFDIAAPVANPPPAHLTPETQRHFALSLPVRSESRPTLPVNTATLVFADPSYDRSLAGPGGADTLRDGNGAQWKLTLDRQEYGADTPIYFALGQVAPDTGLFAPPGATTGTVKFKRQRANIKGQPAVSEPLQVADFRRAEYAINAGTPYGITVERFRTSDNQPVVFLPGDQIVVEVKFKVPMPDLAQPGQLSLSDVSLIVLARIVLHPIIAPPPAVYALVVPDGKEASRVVLHATAPLPQRVEFPDLLNDLAVGHIRRSALFVWQAQTWSETGPTEATLVKVDRAGGGQVPDQPSDLQDILPLPALP